MTLHRFYVGTHDKHGKRVKRGVGPAIAKHLTAVYGGVTMYRTERMWRDDTGKVKAERAVVYEVVSDETPITRQAAWIREMAGQACVLYTRATVDGQFVRF